MNDFMNAAHEALHWVHHNPVHDAFGLAAIAIGSLAAIGFYTEYREHRQNRREIDALDAELPDTKPIKLPPLDAEYRP